MSCYNREGHGGCSNALWPIWVTIITFVLAMALTACAGKTALPPPAPPAVEVFIPVTKPCEVEQVEQSALVSADGVPAEILEAVKHILADRFLLLGDRENLVAANTDPCPELKP